jgi:hypothetical protein
LRHELRPIHTGDSGLTVPSRCGMRKFESDNTVPAKSPPSAAIAGYCAVSVSHIRLRRPAFQGLSLRAVFGVPVCRSLPGCSHRPRWDARGCSDSLLMWALFCREWSRFTGISAPLFRCPIAAINHCSQVDGLCFTRKPRVNQRYRCLGHAFQFLDTRSRATITR